MADVMRPAISDSASGVPATWRPSLVKIWIDDAFGWAAVTRPVVHNVEKVVVGTNHGTEVVLQGVEGHAVGVFG